MGNLLLVFLAILVIIIGIVLSFKKSHVVGGDESLVKYSPNGSFTIKRFLRAPEIVPMMVHRENITTFTIGLKDSKLPVDIITYRDGIFSEPNKMTEIGKSGKYTLWSISLDNGKFDEYLFKVGDQYFNGQLVKTDAWRNLSRFVIRDVDEFEEMYSTRNVLEDALDTENPGQMSRYINTIYSHIFTDGEKSTDEQAKKIIQYLDRGAYPVQLSDMEIQNYKNAGLLNPRTIALAKIKKYQKQSGSKIFTLSDI